MTTKRGGITWGVLNHKVIYGFDYMVLQGCETIKNHYISTIRVSMAIKLGRMLTYGYIYKGRWPFDHVVFLDHVTK